MKLIVLYGPENSGKTTTLKMVYEYLKRWNLYETNWFMYYDRNEWLNDLRDVLILAETDRHSFKSNIGISSPKQNKRGVDIPYSKDDINSVFDKNNDVLPFPIAEDIENTLPLKEPQVLSSKDKIVPKELPDDIIKIGIISEGDYGSSTKKKGRDLYSHLKELDFCDIIICACSRKSMVNPPILCLNKFISETSAKYYVVHARKGATASTKKSNDIVAAKLILYYLSII